MFTETSCGENVGEVKRGLSRFDFGIESISSSHKPYESSCVGTNESSSIMAQSDVSGADLLAFDSISVSERLKPKDGLGTDCISTEALDPIGQVHPSEQRFHSEKDTCKYNSSGLASVAESSGHGASPAREVFDGVDESCKLNDPLIVYRSSQRSAFNNEKNHKKSRKTSKCRRNSRGNLGVNLDSLLMSRKSRSSCSKRAESSVWGYTRNILPDSEEDRGTDLNLENEKLKTTECGKGKRNSRDQMGQQSMGKRFIPTGHISLKIKIGNKICGMNTATESLPPTVKDRVELYGLLDNKLRQVLPEAELPLHERNLETYTSSTKLEASSALDKQSFNSSNDCHHVTSTEDQAASVNIRSDVGTSPDSEVINPVPSVPLCDKGLPDLQESAIMSTAFVSPTAMSNHILSPKKSKKAGKQDNPHQPGKCTLKIRLPGTESLKNAKVPISKGDYSSLSIPQTKSKKGKMKLSLTNCVGAASDCVPAATVVPTGSEVCNKSVPSSSVVNFTKHSGGKRGSRNRSRTKDTSNKKDKTSKKKGMLNNAIIEHQEDEKIGDSGVFVENQTLSDHWESGAWKFPSSTVREHYTPRNAWVLCDECEKWRRIPAKLADQIEETNCGWTCKENTDRDFADCSIPQEKSNSEINEELEISEASGEEDAGDTIPKSNKNRPKVPQQSSWSLIKSNLLLHRSRKTQTIDEVMVCHCKPPSDGKLGCGAKCLNRMLNIECVRGTCPCGELCSNQQFQKRNYAKLKWFKCGRKGYGLQALKDISNGQFLIEYVGEILDVNAYEARQREYALNGHRHFYFMTLNGSEVIDACAKGNLARFINHSCSPNCRTEKWMVNGEVCVGLFALRDIKKGEEVTFDYNYVRVFGAAAKKCVCGSSNCRGYIGGDPTNAEVIVQDDSDDEFSEPVMTCGDRELNEDWKDIMLTSSNGDEKEIANAPEDSRFNMKKPMSSDGEGIIASHTYETVTQRVEGPCSAQVKKHVASDTLEVGSSAGDDSVERLGANKVNGESSKGSISSNLKADGDVLQSQIQLPSKPSGSSLHTDGISGKAIPSIPGSSAIVSTSKSLSDTAESKSKLKYAAEGERGELAMPNSFSKAKNTSSSVRKGKPKSKVIHEKETPDLDKFHGVLNKSKKLPELNINSQFEAVKEALNELLEPDGGISKRKDASRGYLKLLYLTAASGNNGHGEGIQSNRDLSMILDALLKTKSRTVLDDIINKNGLQMLHNIMKRYRKDYNRTPILRKLLKVLEHLALLEILTLKHITGGPPCVGVESFKDSILFFTEHDDRQVHQIARNFRDRWIPRPLRKNYCPGREKNGRSEVNHHSNYGDSSRPTDYPGDKGLKPPEASSYKVNSAKDSTPDSSRRSGTKRKSRWDIPGTEYPNSRTRTNYDNTLPPGFSPPFTGNHHLENSHDTFLGDPQPRFAACMPVSYGIPYSVKRQVGTRPDRSEVAPAVPFHPFPPLPPFAQQQQQDIPTAKTNLMNKESAEYSGQNHRRTSSSSSPKKNISNHLPDGVSSSLGRKYFRQQKWNHSKFAPLWARMRND